MDLDANRIADLIREGRKIEAIKELREATGIGLKEAKDEIDRLERTLEGTSASTSSSGQDLPDDVRALVASGKKIEAIKALRERTGMGLREAKEAVERVAGPSGCGAKSAVLLIVAIGSLLRLLFH